MLFGYTPLDFQQFKVVMLGFTGLGKDALHIYAGMGLFLFVRLMWRWRGGWMLAWLAVLAMACTVEWIDMKAEGAADALQPDAAHWHDIWNTMFWPSVLLLVGRWLQPKPKPKTEMSGDLADQALEEPTSI
ncbi:MAG TPA: hypothetical protein PKC48_00610 [Sphingorhabdus sp.]|jgi:hypothetical protein|uniref:hypothetical protein n=1 Tax=Sphingorhabdus sp. TaxID=1902408 RepID=UPI002B71D93F|nr:hypothetical protein [Sphingorhabdus sp.]HMT40025.1 hypothetical protein [Sphingorhabdus sp.]HMU20751.1 hypothetical protein [Sphingorhabdus sp.]